MKLDILMRRVARLLAEKKYAEVLQVLSPWSCAKVHHICTVLEDKTKVWYVKMPEFIELDGDRPSIQTPSLRMLEDDETNLSVSV